LRVIGVQSASNVDPVLSLLLVQLAGAHDTQCRKTPTVDKPGVINTPILARTAVKLKLAKDFDLGKPWSSIGRRYWTARRAHLYKPGQCALIHDGSSFKQESMVSVLGGFSAGEHITMHPPVQEPIPRIFFVFF